MKINRIYLKNFKKFENDEFEFNPRLNIVFGPNESGK
jgi:chromosome segregation ATPase